MPDQPANTHAASADAPAASTPAVSVIIPVYNVERWLERAVASIQAQTFTDWELWLVDDGSTDGSGALCDRLAQDDPRIRVIHRANGGAASARNEALAQAQGTFVYFMDGDDWCEPAMLEDLVGFAQRHGLDLAIAGFYIDTYSSEEDCYRELRTAPDAVYATQEAFRVHAHELFDAQLLYAPWNKLYRRSYLIEHDLRFPETFWDDLPFNLAVVQQIANVGCLPQRYYHFLRARAESENTKYRPDMLAKREDEHRWLCELYAAWGFESKLAPQGGGSTTGPSPVRPAEAAGPDEANAAGAAALEQRRDQIEEFLARRYSERLVGCIENVTNPSCALTRPQKREEVAAMLQQPHAQRALALARPKSAYLKLMLTPLRQGNVGLSLAEGSTISWVRTHASDLFARLKANR